MQKIYTFEVEAKSTGLMSVLANTEAEARLKMQTLRDNGECAWSADLNEGIDQVGHLIWTEEQDQFGVKEKLEQGEKNEEYYAEYENEFNSMSDNK